MKLSDELGAVEHHLKGIEGQIAMIRQHLTCLGESLKEQEARLYPPLGKTQIRN